MRFSIAFLLLLAGPALAGPTIQHWMAPTGAKVYFVENRSLPILDVNIDFIAGEARTPADKAGLAGMTAGLLDAGAAGMDEERIAARLVDLAARLSFGADHDKASVSLRTLSSTEERQGALALLRDVLSAPTFPEEALSREKTRTIAALKEAATRPEAIVAKRFATALYGEHPYGRQATPESIANLTRADLVAFHQRFYVARNAVVSILGDVSRAEAEAIAVQLTEALPAGEAVAPLPPVVPPQATKLTIEHPAAQAHIRVGLPAVKRSMARDYFALLVGNYTLGGGGFVSRLMKEVREKRGFAYSIYSTFTPRVLEGPFEIGLQTRRDQAGAALEVVNAVLADFLAKGPTAKELTAAKKNLIASQALRIDSNAKLIGYLSLIGFHGLPLDYLDQLPRHIAAVTREDVIAAFRRHIRPEHLVTVVVAGE